MKKLSLLILSIVVCTSVFAQKASVKNDQILSDGTAIANIEKDGCGALSPTCNFYIRSMDGEPLITIVALELLDPMQANVGNPDGKVRFLRFSFTDINGVAEVRNPAMLNTRPKDIAPSIVKARLIKDGKLDDTAVLNFIKANGDRYTQRQKELNPQIIIVE